MKQAYQLFFIFIAQDGRIVVYGGILESDTPVSDPLVVLDVTVQPFRWSIPNINYTPSSTPSRHTSTLVGNLMIVAFGIIID